MATNRPPQDYNFSSGLANINPAEVPEEAIQKYRDSLDEGVKALQERYAQPNYFKIAAGFAKPQLGGFIASLGSAADAMGENVELERAQQLPISQMKAQIAQSNILLGQKQQQNNIYQEWLAKNTGPDGKVAPMDATTFSRITSLGDSTPIANAAKAYYEGAQQSLNLNVAATTAMGKDPMLQLDDFAKFQTRSDIDPKQLEAKQKEFVKVLDAGKPPQTDPAQWAAMSRYEKMEQAAAYATEQREKGMSVEEVMRQKADSAPDRLKLLGAIRGLAVGEGIPTIKTKDGTELTGQQQMAKMLDMFGGSDVFQVAARAVADGKLGETLQGMDKYARQLGMTAEARDKFQMLVKTLADQQVAMRNSSINPTDALSELQQAASPSIGNSQKAIISLVDMMAHGEKANQERYNFAKEKKIPYGRLENNEEYLDLRRSHAKKYKEIATSDPLMGAPAAYNPASGNVTSKPQAAPARQQGSGAPRASADAPRAPVSVKGEDDPAYVNLKPGEQYIFNGRVKTKK